MSASNGFGTGFGVVIGLAAGLALLLATACGGCMGLAWLGRQSHGATHRAMQEAPPDRPPGGAVEPR